MICAERRRQVWRKSSVEVMENEYCKLVQNAVFYWEPIEFFQKQCDMIMHRFFQDKLRGTVLNLLYASSLFIGYTLLQSNLDVIMDATSFSVEVLDRNGRIDEILLSARNVVRQRLLMCCFTGSVWSGCTPRYVTVSEKECYCHQYLLTCRRPSKNHLDFFLC